MLLKTPSQILILTPIMITLTILRISLLTPKNIKAIPSSSLHSTTHHPAVRNDPPRSDDAGRYGSRASSQSNATHSISPLSSGWSSIDPFRGSYAAAGTTGRRWLISFARGGRACCRTDGVERLCAEFMEEYLEVLEEGFARGWEGDDKGWEALL